MSENLELNAIFPVTARRLYDAWLDSQAHGAFTGGAAHIDAREGGAFTAWDGYISGVTLKLDPPYHIQQSWRTSEFPENAPDSLLDVIIDETSDGTRLTLLHTEIPDGQSGQYAQGWKDFYFEPMRVYFAENP